MAQSAFNKLVAEVTESRDHAKTHAVAAMKTESLEQLRVRAGFIDALEQVLAYAAQLRREAGVDGEEVQ